MKIIDLDKENNIKEKPRNREYIIVTYVMLALLIGMCGYFCYFMVFTSEGFINNSYNQRLSIITSQVVRGDIITRDGEVVATSIIDKDGRESRVYPKGNLYAHAVGFSTNGLSGLEKDYNFSLLRSHAFILTRLSNELSEKKNPGDTLVSTLDSRLQEIAHKKLGNYRGAVIAMDPSSGEVLCDVSKPDFDPNAVALNWESLSTDNEASALINRATQGLYPPGSTFKILTALEYLREGGNGEERFNCTGSFTNGDDKIRCYHNTVHGDESFMEAFYHSCNSTFAQIGLTLDKQAFNKLCDTMLFNTDLPTSLKPNRSSSFNIDDTTSPGMMMQTAIGQGTTLVSPLHMLMIASAISNNGILNKPRLVSEIVNNKGISVRKIKTETYGSLLSEEDANTLSQYMRGVVTEGTARILRDGQYEAYGKTGTAEYSSDTSKAHSWFVGFAKKDGKEIAIAVIMEGAGAGSEYATPLAKEIFDAYFNNP